MIGHHCSLSTEINFSNEPLFRTALSIEAIMIKQSFLVERTNLFEPMRHRPFSLSGLAIPNNDVDLRDYSPVGSNTDETRIDGLSNERLFVYRLVHGCSRSDDKTHRYVTRISQAVALVISSDTGKANKSDLCLLLLLLLVFASPAVDNREELCQSHTSLFPLAARRRQ